jgi:hypothetical protein
MVIWMNSIRCNWVNIFKKIITVAWTIIFWTQIIIIPCDTYKITNTIDAKYTLIELEKNLENRIAVYQVSHPNSFHSNHLTETNSQEPEGYNRKKSRFIKNKMWNHLKTNLNRVRIERHIRIRKMDEKMHSCAR